jgi:hypothetical protein
MRDIPFNAEERRTRRLRGEASWISALCVAACFASVGFAADPISAGNGTLIVGGRPNKIFLIDEATEKVKGEILCKTGTPINLTLSLDRKRFYLLNVAYEDVEVLDVEKKVSIDSFRLSEGNKKMRIFGFAPDPLNRFMVLFVKTATKLADRYEISPPALLQYDLAQHKVVRTIPWPKGEEREGIGMRFSPDGKLLYLFGDEILAFDTTDFKQVDKWDLSRPPEEGLGRLNFGFPEDLNEETGFYTSIFNMQDPVQNRRIMGIARVNLAKKNVDFFALGPATGVGSFALAPGRQWGYGLQSEIGKYEFWSFDLANHRLGPKAEFAGRPRMSLKTSSNGKVLYIHGAGNTIDLYQAGTYRYLRTMTLDADTTTGLYVLQ